MQRAVWFYLLPLVAVLSFEARERTNWPFRVCSFSSEICIFIIFFLAPSSWSHIVTKKLQYSFFFHLNVCFWLSRMWKKSLKELLKVSFKGKDQKANNKTSHIIYLFILYLIILKPVSNFHSYWGYGVDDIVMFANRFSYNFISSVFRWR